MLQITRSPQVFDVVVTGTPISTDAKLGFNDAVFAANSLSSQSHGTDSFAVLQAGKGAYSVVPAGLGFGDVTRKLTIGIPDTRHLHV